MNQEYDMVDDISGLDKSETEDCIYVCHADDPSYIIKLNRKNN